MLIHKLLGANGESSDMASRLRYLLKLAASGGQSRKISLVVAATIKRKESGMHTILHSSLPGS